MLIGWLAPHCPEGSSNEQTAAGDVMDPRRSVSARGSTSSIRSTKALQCRVEELPLPTRAIQLSGEVLSTNEAASAELHEAEAAHQTRNSRHLFKAAPTTPCICREQQLETGVSQ